MAQKIKLGSRPKSFLRTISFGMLEGGEGCMEVSFKYRTRKELAILTDEIQSNAKAQADADVESIKVRIEKKEALDPLRQIDLLDRDISLQVDYVMQVLEGWNLDEKFNRDAVEQLADELPAAIAAIIDGYRTAINQGRAGN